MPIPGINHSSRRVVPDAPLIGTSSNQGLGRAFNNGRIDTTFSAPSYDGGLPITGYTAIADQDGTKTGTNTVSPISTTNLNSATTYSFKVRATNAIGNGSLSASSNTVIATTVPQAPTIGSATAGNATATVSFSAPASNGGSAITGYIATSSPGGITGTGTSSPITVSGLTNGTAYTFTVVATNTNGNSAASGPSNSVTPVAGPFFPPSFGPFFPPAFPFFPPAFPFFPPAFPFFPPAFPFFPPAFPFFPPFFPPAFPFFPPGFPIGIVPYGGCFEANVLISTPNGMIPAKDVKVGDVVHAIDIQELSTDETAMPWQAWESTTFTPTSLVDTTITNVIEYERPIVIDLNGDLITPEHPVLVKSADTYSFKIAGDVAVGDFILRRGGNSVEELVWTEVVTNTVIEGTFKAYLFSAEDYDVIFAANHLSHNK